MHRPLPLLQLVNSMLPSPLIALQPLQPDRAASTYQQSYTKFHQQKLSSKLSQTQKQQLLQQIQQLREQLIKSKNLSKRKESEYHERLLLMSMEVERVRTIMREQGGNIDRIKHQWGQLQSVYMLKLQEIKIQLNKQFQDQLKAKTHESSTIIQQVRQLYIQKISSLTQSYEKQLKNKEYQASHHQQRQVKLQISQMKQQQLQTRVIVLNRENQRMEREMFVLRKQLQDQRANINMAGINGINGMMNGANNGANYNSNSNNKSRQLQQDYEQTVKHNNLLTSQMQQLRSNMKQTSHKLQQQLTKLHIQAKSKDQELQMMKWKYHKLQQELNEFKNRKTASNMLQTIGQNKKTLFFNNLRVEKEEQPRRQTEERISYQQSLKKLYELEMKVDQLNTQLIRKDQLIQEQDDMLDQKTLQVNSLKKSIIDKENAIKQLMQQLTDTSRKDQPHDMGKKDAVALIQKEEVILGLKQEIERKETLISKLQREIEKLGKKEKQLHGKLTQIEDSFSTKLKAKQNEIKAKQNEIKAKQNEIKVKDNEIKTKDNQIKAKDNEIKVKDNQIKARDNQLKARDNQIKTRDSQIKARDNQMKSKQSQIKSKQSQIKSKDNQIKARDSQIKVKQSELKLKQNQLKSKQSLIKAQQAQLKQLKSKQHDTKSKQHDIKSKQHDTKSKQHDTKSKQHDMKQLKSLTQQNRSLKQQAKNKNIELQQTKEQLAKYHEQMTIKSEQLKLKQEQLKIKQEQLKKLSQNKTNHVTFTDQTSNKKLPLIKEKKPKQQKIKDPFADPFMNTDDNDTINNDNNSAFDINPHKNNIQHSHNLQTKLQQYQQKISYLQSLVHSLQLQWDQTQQNQNGIFTYIKATYIDQVKSLQAKYQESQKMNKQLEEMLDIMAKKTSPDVDGKNKIKPKK